jgi:LPXTG-site transpeptidase (sortase) family protein
MAIKKVEFGAQDIKQIFEEPGVINKVKRLITRSTKQLGALIFLFAVFYILINSGAFWVRLRYSIAAEPVQTPPAVTVPPEPVIDYPPEIIIPKLGVRAPLILNVAPGMMLDTLHNGVAHYADTALPGYVGNVVVVGHSSDYPWSPGQFKTVFALIDKLVVGDQITVPYTSQQFVYEVIETKVVRPTELSVLAASNEPRLTLITCYPVGTTQKRYIVTARLVEGTTIGVQATEPLIESLPTAR